MEELPFMVDVLEAAERLESSKDVESPISEQDVEHLKRKLSLQLRVNRAELAALHALDTMQRRRHTLLLIVSCALIALEVSVIACLVRNHEVSSTTFRYVLLPLSVLAPFFFTLVFKGAWVSASVRHEVDLAMEEQWSAIDWTMSNLGRVESSKSMPASKTR
jgi:hypothetical protein